MEKISPLKTVKNKFQDILQFTDDDKWLFDIVPSIMLATMHENMMSPIWMYIIGPPGSGKTESISPYSVLPNTMFVSTMTENTLASGYRDDKKKEDPSLLLKLDKKVLVVKDISCLINDSKEKVTKIWGDLRDAYDGCFSKSSGTQGLVEYKARFGCIMCATGSIDTFNESHQQLGERFLAFRIHRRIMTVREASKYAHRIFKSIKNKAAWRKELETVVYDQVINAYNWLKKNPGLPDVATKYENEICDLSAIVAILRTSPIGFKAEQPELPSRLMLQLTGLGQAHALIDGRTEWNDEDTALIKRVALDTFPIDKRRLLQVLYRRGKNRPFSNLRYLTTSSKMDDTNVSKTLMQWDYLKAVEPDKNEEGKVVGYKLSKEMYDILDEIQFFTGDHMPPK